MPMVRERPRVNDEGDGRKYFTIIPNILFKLGLDPYQLCLYAYIKRVAGEEGACWKSRATIAKEIQMSEGMVTKSRRILETVRPELGNKPLIVVRQEPNKDGGRPRQIMTITDIWLENMARRGDLGNVLPSPHDGLNSPDIKQGHHVTLQGHRTPSKKNSRRNFSNNNLEEFAVASRLLDYLNRQYGPIANLAKETKAIKWLLKSGYSPNQCEKCFESLLQEPWRTAQVSWTTVQANIGAWANKAGKRNLLPETNTGSSHGEPKQRVTDCSRCHGTGMEVFLEHGHETARRCDHGPKED